MTSKTKKKKVDFSVRPRPAKDQLPPSPEQWVREGKGAEPQPELGPHKRLTLNIPTALHTAFKSQCVIQEVTIQERVRLLIERDLASSQPQAGEGARPD
jgi:hypothetical protein